MTDGIPEEIMEFSNFCRIKATRLVGNGSSQMRTIIGEKLLALIPLVNERGRVVIVRNQITNLAGETYADAIQPSYDTPQIVDSHMSLAMLENNFLGIPGGKVMVDPSQDHVVHLQSHFGNVGEKAQQVQAGQADPHELLILLEQTGPHTHEHLQAIAGDPTRKEQIKGMTETWMEMSKMTDQLAQQVAEADEAAAKEQPQQAPDPALIAALAKVHGDTQVKREGMLLKHQLKAQDQKFKHVQKDVDMAHSIRLENFEATRPRPQEKAAA